MAKKKIKRKLVIPHMTKKPPEDWMRLRVLADIVGLTSTGMQTRLHRLYRKDPDVVRARVTFWRNAYYIHPTLEKILVSKEIVPRVKTPPLGWITTAEAHERYGVPASTVSGMVRDGKIKAVRIGRTFYLSPAELMRYLEQRERRQRTRKQEGWIHIHKAEKLYGLGSHTIRRWAREGLVRMRKEGYFTFINEPSLVQAMKVKGHDKDKRPPKNARPLHELAADADRRPHVVAVMAKRRGLHYGVFWNEKRRVWEAYVDRSILDHIPERLPDGWIPLYMVTSTEKQTQELKQILLDMGKPVRHFSYRGRLVNAVPKRALYEVIGYDVSSLSEPERTKPELPEYAQAGD